jgi:hypothetical protein
MDAALTEFQNSLKEIKKIRAIYDHMVNEVHLPPNDVSDLLRAQLVNAVSALDRFLHEIVRIGIIQSFMQKRPLTDKFKSFTLTSKTIIKLLKKQAEASQAIADDFTDLINKEVIDFFKSLAFQHPNKIKDALSYIWNEDHKLQIIAKAMLDLPGNTDNDKQKYLEQQLILISERRNQIVHEADYDPSIYERRSITIKEVDDILNLIESFAKTIYANCNIK